MQSEQEIILSESVPSGDPRPALQLDSNRDYALLRQAIKNRWPVDDDLKVEAVKAAAAILKNATAMDRDKLSAVKVLVEMDKVNQSDSLYEDKCRRIDEGMATELMGVAPVIIRQPVKVGKMEPQVLDTPAMEPHGQDSEEIQSTT